MKVKYDPDRDPSNPDSKVPATKPVHVMLRLIRKYGAIRGLKYYGHLLGMASSEEAYDSLDKQARWRCSQALKAVNVAPKDMKPAELGPWFRTGYSLGKLAGEVAKPIPKDQLKTAK